MQLGDDVCADCASELGPEHWAKTQAHQGYARTRLTCDDCSLPMRARRELICGSCQSLRHEAAIVRRLNLLPPSIAG